MKMNGSARGVTAALALILSSGNFTSLTAGEVPLEGGDFDSSAGGWYWEEWSAAGSSVGHDPALDSNNSAGSGSLRLNSNFSAEVLDWQQAVYTLPLPGEVNMGESFNALSFDVKVDPTSAMRFEGDYGSIQVILRNGSNWDWAELGFKPLTSTEWMRVTARFSETTALIDSVRAITIRVAENGMQGPVMVNLDNFVFTEEVVVDPLDNGLADTQPAGWVWEDWSAPGSTVTWDPMDYYGRETSGSARLVHNFLDQPGYQQAVFTLQLPEQVDAATEYSHINVDLRVDPSSMARETGDYGFFEIILRNGPGWDWVATGPPETTGISLNSNVWMRLSMPIRSGDQVHRITFKLGANDLQGPVILNLDNITWTKNSAPPAPPTLEISPARAGLNLVTTGTGQYDRHNIYASDNSSLGWYDAPEPVTYEFSLLDFPAAEEYAGFQAHMFLVPGFPGTATSPDWNEPSLIFLDLRAGEGGAGTATFRWKTDEPGGNSQLYAAGKSNVTSSSVLGTWKVTASQNNHFIVTAPDGSSTEVDLPTAAAAQFAGPIRLYVGVQPNTTPNIGQSALLGHVKVTQGSTVLLEDDFSGETLDELKWVANAPAGGVQYIPPGEAGWMISWGIPDSGFYLQKTASLSNPEWSGVASTPVNLGPLLRQAHVPGSELPGEMAFFRLVKPELVAPADHGTLTESVYVLTNEEGSTRSLWLIFGPDETGGEYHFYESGQAQESGRYVVASDYSNNQWILNEMFDFNGGPFGRLELNFATSSSGTWSFSDQAGSSDSGTFETQPPPP